MSSKESGQNKMSTRVSFLLEWGYLDQRKIEKLVTIGYAHLVKEIEERLDQLRIAVDSADTPEEVEQARMLGSSCYSEIRRFSEYDLDVADSFVRECNNYRSQLLEEDRVAETQ